MTNRLLAAGIAVLLASSPLAHASTQADAIVGQWLIESGDVLINITHNDTGYTGTIAWLKEPRYPDDAIRAGQRKIDLHNPDKTKRSRPLIGLQVLRGFVYDRQGHWSAGTIYDADSGKTYDCTISLTDPNHLTARGYIGWTWFGRTINASRVQAPPPTDDDKTNEEPNLTARRTPETPIQEDRSAAQPMPPAPPHPTPNQSGETAHPPTH